MILSSLPHNVLLAHLTSYSTSALREHHLNRSIAIHLTSLDESLTLHVDQDQLRSGENTTKPDLEISGTLESFMQFVCHEKSSLRLEGDLSLAGDLQTFLHQTQIHTPRLFSAFFGPLLGAQIANTLPKIAHMASQSLAFISDSITQETPYTRTPHTFEEIKKTFDTLEKRLEAIENNRDLSS